MKVRKILVTGATGFVGRELIKKLAKVRRYELYALVRSGKDRSFRSSFSGAKIVKGDITDKKKLNKGPKNFDIIIHLAASLQMFENQNIIEGTNVLGLKNILETYCVDRPVLFIFASTIDIGRRDNDYVRSKLIGEQMVARFARSHPHMEFINVRIGNVYPEDKGFAETFFGYLVTRDSWQASIISHHLRQKRLFPIGLGSLCQKLVALINKPLSGKTISLYDQQIAIGKVVDGLFGKGRYPGKIPFAKFIGRFWLFLGWLTRRGDMLVYLLSEK